MAAVALGSRIRQRRRALGLTQQELAEPMTKGFVSAVQRGRSLPSLAALCLFAARLQTSVGGLLEGAENLAGAPYTPNDENHNAQSHRD